MEPSDVQYARSSGISIAYQVVGEGPVDLVYVPLNLSIAVGWEQPLVAAFYQRLASFSRLILFDKRGTGLSDRPRTAPTLETQMDDVRVVLDAVGSDQAALFGGGHGAQMCALFAATYPERSTALILYNPTARLSGTREQQQRWLTTIRDGWGTRELLDSMFKSTYPSFVGDEQFERWFARSARISASPGAAFDFLRTFAESDITEVLPAIRVPTLVLYRRDVRYDNLLFSVFRTIPEDAQSVAAAIPGARLVAVPGTDIPTYVGTETADEVEHFLASRETPKVLDRVLATLLFTDIVDSTAQLARLGDTAWLQLLSAHRATVRRELARFRGDEVDTAGDGFFATFDGPARAIECARSVVAQASEHGLEIRAGLHTGECELVDRKVTGLAVHIGARVAAEAQPGEILVSGTVKDLVAGSELEFDDRGLRQLKGVPGEWRLFAVS